jgi:hypothetical protein
MNEDDGTSDESAIRWIVHAPLPCTLQTSAAPILQFARKTMGKTLMQAMLKMA